MIEYDPVVDPQECIRFENRLYLNVVAETNNQVTNQSVIICFRLSLDGTVSFVCFG